jgi:membrane fusion protein, macrolide-specific efflux system
MTANLPPRTRRRGRLAVAIAALFSAGIVLAQVLQQPQQPQQPPAPQPSAPVHAPVPPAPAKADVVTVQRGDIEQTVEAAGKLLLYKYVDANAQVAGQIKAVLAGLGDTVQAGDVVIEMAPTTQPAKIDSLRAQMDRLQAELADHRAQLDFAELQFKRQSQLKAQNATREEKYDSARMSLSSAGARVEAINAQIRQVEAELKVDQDNQQHTQILAPIAGTVVALNARPGQIAGTAQAASLMRIADLSKMTVQARVAEIDVTRLRRGMTANFKTPGYPGRTWSGKLRQVIPVPAEGSGEQGKPTFYNVLFEVDNPEHELMSGMSAQVQFVVAQAKNALLLPVAALGKPDADGVYHANVLDGDGQASARQLKIGIRNKEFVQILSGLNSNEQVLLGPEPGARRKPGAPAAAPLKAALVAATVPAAVGPAGPAR